MDKLIFLKFLIFDKSKQNHGQPEMVDFKAWSHDVRKPNWVACIVNMYSH